MCVSVYRCTRCGSNDSRQVKPLEYGGTVTHMIYPHDLFAMIFKRYRSAFNIHLGAEEAKLESFWTGFLNTEYGRVATTQLDTLRGKTPADLNHTIPLIIHGDACPVTHKRSAMFTQWSSLLGRRQSDIPHQLHKSTGQIERGILGSVLHRGPGPA